MDAGTVGGSGEPWGVVDEAREEKKRGEGCEPGGRLAA